MKGMRFLYPKKKINVKDINMPRKKNTPKKKVPKTEMMTSKPPVSKRNPQRLIDIAFYYTFKVYNKDKDKTYDITKQRFAYKGKRGGLKKASKEWEDEKYKEYKESNTEILDIKRVLTPVIRMKLADPPKIRIQRVGSLDINGYIPSRLFNVNENECVMDFFFKTYADLFKHHKVEREDLYQWLNGRTYDDHYDDIGGISIDYKKLGINTNEIFFICKEFSIPLRAFDDEMGMIKFHNPKKPYYCVDRKKIRIKALYYMVKSNHLYPLTETKARSVSKKGTCGFVYKKKEEKKKEKKTYEFLKDEDKCSIVHLIDTMKEHNKEPTYIRNAKKGKIKFCIDNIEYIPFHKDEIQPIIDYCSKYGIEYEGQTSATAFTSQFTDLLTKSSFNNQLSTIFNTYKRGQVHMGLMKEFITEQEIKNKKVLDLKKCHRNILLNPNNDWFKYSAIDQMEKFETLEYDGEDAFYYVETDDINLFSGDGLYTNKIIDVAKKDKIKYEILGIARPTGKINKNIFKKPIEKFLTGDDTKSVTDFKKMVINTIAGCLGADSRKNQFLKVNKDLGQVSNNIYENEKNHPERKTIIHKEQDYYIYGVETKTYIINNNRPVYLQVIEQSNIKLYNLQKKIQAQNGVVLFRYSDELHYIGDDIPETDEYEYKQTKFDEINKWHIERPTKYSNKVLKQQIELVERDWVLNPENNSEQKNIIINKLLKTGGLITGMGGTGKSHIIHRLMDILTQTEKTFETTAYTNVASRLIKGRTLHSVFCISEKQTELAEGKIKNSNMPEYLIVDEASMLNSFMYNILNEVKKYHSNTKIILLGDFNQIQPIGEEELDFENSFIIKHLTKHQRWNLEINHRTTTDGLLVRLLTSLTLDGYDNQSKKDLIKQYIRKSDDINEMALNWNIGYNNLKTSEGKRINDILNNQHAIIRPNDIMTIPECPYKVIKGMRVICNKSSKSHPVAKNGILKVVGTHCDEDNKFIGLDDIMIEGTERVWLKYPDFIKYFNPAYLITSDKSQGQTFKGKVFIHQLNKILRNGGEFHRGYVALGRATSIENLFIANI